jgi:polyphenol oxidase
MAIKSLSDKNTSYNVFITDRLDGNSIAPYATLNLGLHVCDDEKSVLANRQQIADWLNVPTNQVVYMDQVHGNQGCIY